MMHLIKFLSCLLLVNADLYSFPGLAQGKTAGGNNTQPNVILIYSDDQGAVDLNCYGAKDLITPNLDQLARKGVRFSQFYAASPVCSPSRASLLTGRYPQRAGLSENASSQQGEEGMPTEQVTLAEMFKEGGYQTAHIGKWHVGYTPETMPNGQGFDYSFGFMGGCIDNYSHYFYWQGPNRHDLWRNGEEVWEPGRYFPDLLVGEANGFMEKNKNHPFFLYLAINIPHYPLQGEKKWLDRYQNLPSPRNQYAAFVSTMDERIGLVLARLKELGLEENTIVIFQADQGFSKEERTFGGGGNAGPLRGSKFSLFEGGIRVPAIIGWPGHIAQNEIRHQLAANIDWLPTLAQYCHLQLPNRLLDGKSLAAVIGSKDAASPHADFFWQSGGKAADPQWAVRSREWKLLHRPLESEANELDKEGLMLVNMATDQGEQTNEAAKNPEIVKTLKQKYETWRKAVFQP